MGSHKEWWTWLELRVLPNSLLLQGDQMIWWGLVMKKEQWKHLHPMPRTREEAEDCENQDRAGNSRSRTQANVLPWVTRQAGPKAGTGSWVAKARNLKASWGKCQGREVKVCGQHGPEQKTECTCRTEDRNQTTTATPLTKQSGAVSICFGRNPLGLSKCENFWHGR